MSSKGFTIIRRVDANQPEIVARFREWDCTVQHLHAIGHGCPDLLVGYRGRNYLIEIKDGSRPPSARKLTPDEKAWQAAWHGGIYIVENIEDVDALVAFWTEAGLVTESRSTADV